MTLINSKQLQKPVSGSFTGSFTGQFSGSIQGGQPYAVASFDANNKLITSSIYSSGSFTAINHFSGPEDPTNPEILYVNGDGVNTYNLISAHGNSNRYVQLNIQNYNNSTQASSDIVATADNGNSGSVYIDMGINSSGFTDTTNIGAANDAYMYSYANDLYIGNASVNKKVVIFNGGFDTIANSKIYIHDQGTVGINTALYNPYNPPSLQINAPNSSTYNVVQIYGDTNNYSQLANTNRNGGPNASADIVAYNDIDPDNQLAGYIDMGINSTNYAPNIYYPGYGGDAYLFTDSHNLLLGTLNPTGSIVLFAGGADSDVYDKLTLRYNNQHSLTGSLNITGSLIVTNGLTASLQGTSSYALTASYAMNGGGTNVNTSSLATTGSNIFVGDQIITGSVNINTNLTVGGDITAQTLHVQSVTSSVEFVTGSTHFGSIISNTHQFTGSLSISGSLNINGTSYLASTSGTSGANGTSGTSGAQGSSGASGTSGTSGAQGTSGSSGNSGTSGSSGINGTSGTSGNTGTSGSSGINGTSGSSGVNGTSGTSGANGTSGTSGVNGTSGSSGAAGTSGTSGANGTSGTAGTRGTSGTSGTSGANGTSGTSGANGTSGTSGINGTSGTSGANGTSGTSGTSGANGTSGSSGANGANGTSGTSGINGANGTSGSSGINGVNGTSGSSGSSGTSGANGTSGTSGANGTSGTSGANGTSGTSGANGTSGTSGANGTSGTSGATGTSGTSGTSGANGTSGSSGNTGTSGTSGANGTSGSSGVGFSTINNAGLNRIIVSDGTANAATASANLLYTGNIFTINSTVTSGENTLIVGLPANGGAGEGGQILLQASGGLYSSASMLDNYQNKFRLLRGTNAGSDAFKLQIDLQTGQLQLPNYNSAGAFTGTAAGVLGFDTSGNIITTNTAAGTSGTSGVGTSGTSGAAGATGTSGTSGANGTSGTSGANGANGTSGTSGAAGVSGTAGTSGNTGTSGTSGANGTSGTSGANGTSGTSGINGTSGTSGSSGANGTSGSSGATGTSGTSGANGGTGTSGTSGANGTSGTSGAVGNSGTAGTSGVTGTSGTSGIANITIADEGINQGSATFLNFIGTGVSATVANSTASINISGGGGSGTGGITGSYSFNSGSQNIITINTGSNNAAFYNYLLVSGSNFRAGQFITAWSGSNISYTDISTVDIGSTYDVVFTSSLSGANYVISASPINNGWLLKTLLNSI